MKKKTGIQSTRATGNTPANSEAANLGIVGITATTYFAYNMMQSNYSSMKNEYHTIKRNSPAHIQPVFQRMEQMHKHIMKTGDSTSRFFRLDLAHQHLKQKVMRIGTQYPMTKAAKGAAVCGCMLYVFYNKRVALYNTVINTANDIRIYANHKGEQMENIARNLEEADFNEHLQTSNTFNC